MMPTFPQTSWEERSILAGVSIPLIVIGLACFSLGYATGDWSLVAGEWVLR